MSSASSASSESHENVGVDNISMEEVISVLKDFPKKDKDEETEDKEIKERKRSRCERVMYSLFVEHPASVNMNYFQHFMRGISLAFQTGVATCVLVVHSFVPKFFPKAGSSIIASLHKEIEEFNKKLQ